MTFKPDSSEENSLEWALRQFWRISDADRLHTAGNSPTPPATGASWNAHGNTATGDATNYLRVDKGTFVVGVDNVNDTPTGDVPDFFDSANGGSGRVNAMAYIPSKGSFVAGVLGKFWQNSWSDAFLGDGAVGLGTNVSPQANKTLAFGEQVWVTQVGGVGIGTRINNHGGNGTILIAVDSDVDSGAAQCLMAGIFVDATVAALFGVGLGANIQVHGPQTVAVGVYAEAGTEGDAVQDDALAVGLYVSAPWKQSITIGSGFNAVNKLINDSSKTMWIGVASTVPTVIMKKQGTAASDTAFMGIIEQDPLSTLDIGGSVGFKYDTLTGSNGGSDPLTDEYSVYIDMAAVTTTYTVNLPEILTTAIDRRVYYLKIISSNGTWNNGSSLVFDPHTNDGVETWSGGTPNGVMGADGVSISIPMSGSSNRGMSLTFHAKEDDGGWWII